MTMHPATTARPPEPQLHSYCQPLLGAARDRLRLNSSPACQGRCRYGTFIGVYRRVTAVYDLTFASQVSDTTTVNHHSLRRISHTVNITGRNVTVQPNYLKLRFRHTLRGFPLSRPGDVTQAHKLRGDQHQARLQMNRTLLMNMSLSSFGGDGRGQAAFDGHCQGGHLRFRARVF
jgi:hypothetical protein